MPPYSHHRGLVSGVLLTLTLSLAIHDGSAARAQAPIPASGQAETTSQLSGTFVLAEPRATVDERVHHAIDEAVSHVNFFIRGIAADRLRGTNVVPDQVRIEIQGDSDAVSYDDVRYEATEGEWRSIIARGQPTQLLMQHDGPRLYATFRGEDGEKQQVHTVSPDGRNLWLDIRVTSDRLPEPLTYRVRYRRE